MDNNDNNQLSQITTTNLLPSDDEIDNYWSSLLNSPTVGLISNNDRQMVNPVGNDQCSTSTTTSSNSLLPSEIINKESINYEEEEAVIREGCCVDNKVDDKGKGLTSTSMRTRKAKSVPRFEFRTRSSEDILDDGFRWRKYGQKSVKNNIYPRSYYRCTHLTCNVKKQVQRLSKDPGIVVTTYEGIHNHPCEKLMEALSPLLNQMQFLSRLG